MQRKTLRDGEAADVAWHTRTLRRLKRLIVEATTTVRFRFWVSSVTVDNLW